ncbi:hypothetical protein QTP81_11495 [Alteromonas sp. ASW11-36]|uniref:Uncharacterized protein n=1 Tax=Alteromonas arenosi TaxID=3055817 RepID=A0ABT7SYF3_9ALTE|nr:hypothetical protein [Alteromonas sp. ASW11-36]MDM7861218.1 hypothetical protein [Alteromonas sp. ASW11-36]
MCKKAKIKVGPLNGLCKSQSDFDTFAKNSLEALKELMPELEKFGPSDKRKAKSLLEKQLKNSVGTYGSYRGT